MRLNQVISLSQFIADQQSKHKEATGDLSKIFRDIKFAAKIVNRDVRKAGLVDILGAFGTVNVQGEEVKKLDMLANEEFKSSLTLGGDCCAIISEEEEDIHHIETTLNVNSKYIIAMDPLDGSSNIDVNASIGTIFSVYKRISPVGGPVTMDDVLQKGVNQVAAGYIIYGSSTMMVFTTGNGVNAFTLDASIGDFCLSHPDIKFLKMVTFILLMMEFMTEWNLEFNTTLIIAVTQLRKKLIVPDTLEVWWRIFIETCLKEVSLCILQRRMHLMVNFV